MRNTDYEMMVTGWTPSLHHKLKYGSYPLTQTKIEFRRDSFPSGSTNEIAG